MRRRRFGVAGADIAGVEFGPPRRVPDVLFLHANGFNAMTYRHVLAPLADVMTVLAVDLRGHGLSSLPAPDGGQAWSLYADDVLALLDGLGGVPAVLAGHSMGATTLLLAAQGLNATARLVLFEPVLPPRAVFGTAAGQPDWATPMAQAARRRRPDFADRNEALAQYRGRGAFKAWPDAILIDYLEDGLVPTPDHGFTLACQPAWEAANFAHYCVSDPYPALYDARIDVRIIKAEHGSTCVLEPDDPRVTMAAGTTHFLPMEQPELVRQAIGVAVGGA